MNAGKFIAPALMLAMLSGCVTYPIAKNLQRQARPLTLAQVKADPSGTRGTTVIWGGRIIDTVNDTNGGAIYVMDLPLGKNEKPLADGNTRGRFIVRSTEFIDPEAFPNGRLITVAGVVAGIQTEPLQDILYTYPVLDIRQACVWPVKRREYYYYYGPGWYWGPGWDWGWGGPYYYSGFYGGWHGGYYGSGWHDGHGVGGWHGGGGGGGWHGH